MVNKSANEFYAADNFQSLEIGVAYDPSVLRNAWYQTVFVPARHLFQRYRYDNQCPHLRTSYNMDFITLRHNTHDVQLRVDAATGGMTSKNGSVLFEAKNAGRYERRYGAFALVHNLRAQALEGNLTAGLWRPNPFGLAARPYGPPTIRLVITALDQPIWTIAVADGTDYIVPLGFERVSVTILVAGVAL
jgi:hypothetical protein